MADSASAIDIESFWEYGDPASSEARFRAALASAEADQRLELMTQIARTYSLRGRFAEAHALLDEAEQDLANASARPRVRYLLERGRTFSSAGEQEPARQLFGEAWTQAQATELAGLAADAAHMLAIAYSGTPDALAWHQRGLAVARASADAKARALIPALLNNAAWELHDLGQFGAALVLFEEAEAEWTARAQPAQIQIARWASARCLRSLGRYSDALAIQRALEIEHMAAGTVDGYVLEEIAENLDALGKLEAAKPYFAQAVYQLSKDDWFVNNQPARLAHLRRRAGR